jgi:hypothetical protein
MFRVGRSSKRFKFTSRASLERFAAIARSATPASTVYVNDVPKATVIGP